MFTLGMVVTLQLVASAQGVSKVSELSDCASCCHVQHSLWAVVGANAYMPSMDSKTSEKGQIACMHGIVSASIHQAVSEDTTTVDKQL